MDILGSDWDRDEVRSLQPRLRAGGKRPRPDEVVTDAAACEPVSGAEDSGACGSSRRQVKAPQCKQPAAEQPRAEPSPLTQQHVMLAERAGDGLLSKPGVAWLGGHVSGHSAAGTAKRPDAGGQGQQLAGVPAPRPPRTKLTARKSTHLTARKSTCWQRWVEPSLDRQAPALGSRMQLGLSHRESVAEAPLSEQCRKPAPGELSAQPASGDLLAPQSSADAADSTQTISRIPDQRQLRETSATGLLLEAALRQAAELPLAALPQPGQPATVPDGPQSAALPVQQPPCAAAPEQGQHKDGQGAFAPLSRPPPRAAAPKPGQLRDFSLPLHEQLHAHEEEQQQQQERQPSPAGADAKYKRLLRRSKVVTKSKRRVAAAKVVERDVADCEADRRARVATFAAAAGARCSPMSAQHFLKLAGEELGPCSHR